MFVVLRLSNFRAGPFSYEIASFSHSQLFDAEIWMPFSCVGSECCRLFSCGTSKDGESHLVEWNESEGAVKRTYQGFRKRSFGVVQFDTTKSRYLAAGDEFSIKFWDVDNIQVLAKVEAEGGLIVSFLATQQKLNSIIALYKVRYNGRFLLCRLVHESDSTRMGLF